MITNNGGKMLTYGRLGISGTTVSYVLEDGTTEVNPGQVTNAYKVCNKNNLDNPLPSGQTSASYGMVARLGFGTTAETPNDYTIDSDYNGVDVNTIITCQGSSQYWNATASNSGTAIFTFTFLHTGNEPITIDELGLYFVNSNMRVLCMRNVISPRTIQPNETVTFNFEMGVN